MGLMKVLGTWRRIAVAGMLLGFMACSAEDVRKAECDDVAHHDYEACRRDARDPRWDLEEKRREALDKAKTDEEKRRKECEALQESEAVECLANIPRSKK